MRSCSLRYIVLYSARSHFRSTGEGCYVEAHFTALLPGSSDRLVDTDCIGSSFIRTTPEDSRGIFRRVEYLLRWLQYCQSATERRRGQAYSSVLCLRERNHDSCAGMFTG